jgi:ribonuclease BN (tRNA processing enzyme)
MGFGPQLHGAFDLHEYEDGVPFTAAGFEITPIRLVHYKERTFGLRVTDGRATLAYSGDTAPTPNLTKLAQDADVFLCEATLANSEPPEERGHLSADEAVAASEAAGAKRLVVIHRPDELPLNGGVERAYDGLELDL